MTNPTINDLVGIPWVKGGCSLSGADCWGIVAMAANVYGVKMTEHYGKDWENKDLPELILGQARDRKKWANIDRKEKRPGDVVMCYSRETGDPTHVGIYVGNGKILHSMKEASCIMPEEYFYRMFRGIGFFRRCQQ